MIKSSQTSWLMILLGVLLIIVPPLVAPQVVNGRQAIFFFSLALIVFGTWRLIRKRSVKPKPAKGMTDRRTTRSSSPSDHENPDASSVSSDIPPASAQTISRKSQNSDADAAVTEHRANSFEEGLAPQHNAPILRQATHPRSSPWLSSTSAPPIALAEEELFDADPEIVRLEIANRLGLALLELFDVDPDPVRQAIAKLLQRELDALFDADPEAIRQSIAERLEEQILELFDIDPVVVRQAIASRNEEQLGELFDADPTAVKEAISELIHGVLFDIDPDEVRKILAEFGENELLELFDVDPMLVKAALKQRIRTEILELFDSDPQKLRATFAWRKNGLAELFDADPEALRALWESQKAVPLGPEDRDNAFTDVASFADLQIEDILTAQQELVESLSLRSLERLKRRRRETAAEAGTMEFSGKISLVLLRLRVVERIVEEKVVRLEIQRRAVAEILSERTLPAALKQQLLLELTGRLTSARTFALQLRRETQAQNVRERLQEQEAARRKTRPVGGLDPNLAERLRQRMLDRSRQK